MPHKKVIHTHYQKHLTYIYIRSELTLKKLKKYILMMKTAMYINDF